jgi:hypothetical protein
VQRRNTRRLVAVTAVSLGLSLFATSAAATQAHSSAADCSTPGADDSLCYGAVYLPGQDPETNGIAQLVVLDRADDAKRIVAARAEITNDEKQKVLEGIVEDASVARRHATVTPRIDGPRAGHVYGGNFWEFDELMDYAYCDVSGCGPKVGSVSYGIAYNIMDYPLVQLNGNLGVGSGPSVRPTGNSCKTYHELWPFDQVDKDWANCSSLNGGGYTMSAQVYDATWTQSGDIGGKYHLELKLEFQVQGDAQGRKLGALYNSHTYTVRSPSYLTSFN